MSGLRAELEQILTPEDGRWSEFGFRVPAAGEIPEKVEGVVVSAAMTGTVIVKWEATRLAENYRVYWRSSTQPAGLVTEVGLFTDKQALITGLPIGESIVVGVRARNRSGEMAPTEVEFVV